MTAATDKRPPCVYCGRPSERITEKVGPVCSAHRKRLDKLRRGRGRLALDAPLRDELSPLERVILAGSLFLEAPSEDDHAYDRALREFLHACATWLRLQGWRPPHRRVDAGDATSPAPLEAPGALELER